MTVALQLQHTHIWHDVTGGSAQTKSKLTGHAEHATALYKAVPLPSIHP